MAQKKTAEQRAEEYEAKAKAMKAKAAAIRKAEKAKSVGKRWKILEDLFPDMSEDEKEFKKDFETLMRYAEKGKAYEDRQKQAQAAQQPGQHAPRQ